MSTLAQTMIDTHQVPATILDIIGTSNYYALEFRETNTTFRKRELSIRNIKVSSDHRADLSVKLTAENLYDVTLTRDDEARTTYFKLTEEKLTEVFDRMASKV